MTWSFTLEGTWHRTHIIDLETMMAPSRILVTETKAKNKIISIPSYKPGSEHVQYLPINNRPSYVQRPWSQKQLVLSSDKGFHKTCLSVTNLFKRYQLRDRRETIWYNYVLEVLKIKRSKDQDQKKKKKIVLEVLLIFSDFPILGRVWRTTEILTHLLLLLEKSVWRSW